MSLYSFEIKWTHRKTVHAFSHAVLSSSKEVYTHLRLHVLVGLDDEAEDPP